MYNPNPRKPGRTMPNREQDWIKQALRDLEQAKDCRAAERHEWACFIAQQAAEKAAKALHLHHAQEAWGHVVAKLLSELPGDCSCSEELLDKARALDSFYIAPRYPNSHAEGPPYEHYGKLQSEEAIRYARQIIDFVRSQMA